MELAVIDAFSYQDVAPRGGDRAGDTPAVSFSDVLDASTRQADAGRPREDRSRREPEAQRPAATEAAPRRADEPAKAKNDERPGKAADQSQPKVKDEPRNTEAKPADAGAADPAKPATPSNEAAPADQAAAPPADRATHQGKGEAALDWIAEALASGTPAIDPGTPKGQIVAAVVVPQNVPQQAAAAEVHALANLAPSGQNGLVAPAPVGAPTGEAPTPSTQPTGNTPVAGQTPFAVPNGNASPHAAAPAMPQPASGADAAAPAPAVPAAPTQPVAAPQPAPAASAATPPAETLASSAASALHQEVVTELTDEPLLPASETATSNPTPSTATSSSAAASANRAGAAQNPSSGYVAQVVSQDPATAEAPVPPPTSVEADPMPADSQTAAALADALPTGDDAIVAGKPGDGLATVAGEVGNSKEAHHVEAAAARAAHRPPVVPMAEQVVVRIAKAVADGVDRINVKLSPAELGHIDVRMEIGPDGRFQAVFAADRPQTLELLQRDARELARALQDAGLRADTGSLSFNLRGQGQQGHADNAPGHGGYLPGSGVADLPAEVAPPQAYRPSGPAAGRVDIRV